MHEIIYCWNVKCFVEIWICLLQTHIGIESCIRYIYIRNFELFTTFAYIRILFVLWILLDHILILAYKIFSDSTTFCKELLLNFFFLEYANDTVFKMQRERTTSESYKERILMFVEHFQTLSYFYFWLRTCWETFYNIDVNSDLYW